MSVEQPENREDSEDHVIRLSPEDVQAYRALADAARLDAALQQHMETRPADLDDPLSLKEHLLYAHQWQVHDFFRDESDRESVPGLSPIDWDSADARGGMPPLTLTDMQVLHSHDHATYPDMEHVSEGQHHTHL